ncbi:MAG: hypothetical protein R3F11_06425 [Verrucomicrobiales bacterium]
MTLGRKLPDGNAIGRVDPRYLQSVLMIGGSLRHDAQMADRNPEYFYFAKGIRDAFSEW